MAAKSGAEDKPDRVAVTVENRSGLPVDESRIKWLVERLLKRTGLPPGEVGVTFVPASEMSRLNWEHMRRKGGTDVLSFPIDAGGAPGEGRAGGPLLLGDIVICTEVAALQAEDASTSLTAELCLLVIHAVLHLAGFDHEADNGEMDRKQAELFDDLCRE